MNRSTISVGARVVAALVALGAFTACSKDSTSEVAYDKPFTLDTIPGSEAKMLTLTEDAMARLGIETGEVSQGTAGLTIPYAAVIYLPDGSTWAYTNRQGNVFVREALTVDEIRGDEALLDSGPEPGTAVAVVGVAELFGAENKVGK